MTIVDQLPCGSAALPVTGRQYQIAAGSYRAWVTELGAGLRELAFGDRPVIVGYQADELPPGAAGQLLAPWPNRVDGGRYSFGGADYQLAMTDTADGNAIHGLTRWMAWTPVWTDAGAVLLRSRPPLTEPRTTSASRAGLAAPGWIMR